MVIANENLVIWVALDRQGKDIDTLEPKWYTSHNWNQLTGVGFVSN